MWLLLLGASALAYESDTLTDRHLELVDVTDLLDARVNEVILESIEATNERTGCDGDVERAHRLLARAIHVRTSANELVADRGGLRAFGFDRYSAWIENGGVPHRDFNDRRDIFGTLTFKEAPLLCWAGVCSTVNVSGLFVGTDKLDHFFEEGYNAWRRADYGLDPYRAIDWATRTENGKYGLESSEAFSYADLRADYDGMRFYHELLAPGGVAVMGEDACLDAAAPFAWGDWIDWSYDEVLNPPVYTPSAQIGVTRHLVENRDAYCGSYAIWGGPSYQAHLERVLSEPVPYATLEAPPRTDPYQLETLCEGWVPESGSTDEARYAPEKSPPEG